MRKIYTKTFVYFAEIQYISKYHYGHTELHVLFFNI